MRYPLSWIQEFVRVSISPERLAEMLTRAGIGVERIERSTIPVTVLVGAIQEIKPHPHADRLKCVSVNLGGEKNETIVCGAPNCAVDQRVAVALPGTKLPNGKVIHAATIRGVASHGMICAEDELGLGKDHTGIIVLPNDAHIGSPAAAVLGSKETVLDCEITPNRADCLSMLGIAREIATLTKKKVRLQKYERRDHGKMSAKELIVRVQDRAACPLYSARMVANVTVGPSPRWLQERLRACGVRPLNNIIDVTNYVMLELGQPLHAFDAAAVTKRTIVVRRAQKGESLLALDGRTYTLAPDMVCIASKSKPIAIAGVMGGEESGIRETTKTVVLESAVFDPVRIRRTSKQLGVATESSYRFERSLDPHGTVRALDRAATLLEKISKGTVMRGRIIIGGKHRALHPIQLSVDRINSMLQLSLTPSAATSILRREGIAVTGRSHTLRATPPTWRPDLRIEEDLIEEIARLVGYASLPRTLPIGTVVPRDLPQTCEVQDALLDAFVALGATECILHPFSDERLVQHVGIPHNQHVRVQNPLSRDQALLRYHILPQLLRKAALANREHSMIYFIEVGRVFAESDGALPAEQEHCGVVLVQRNAYRVLKGMFTAALDMAWIQRGNLRWKTSDTRYGRGQLITLDGSPCGHCTSLSAAHRSTFKFRGEVAVLEIDLGPLARMKREKRYRPQSMFPAVLRDCAFWMPMTVPFERVEAVLARVDPLLVHSELFDVYMAEGKRSCAIHLTFQSPQRTLTAQEVDRILATLTRALERECQATIRR